jgi:hypothetical protein
MSEEVYILGAGQTDFKRHVGGTFTTNVVMIWGV